MYVVAGVKGTHTSACCRSAVEFSSLMIDGVCFAYTNLLTKITMDSSDPSGMYSGIHKMRPSGRSRIHLSQPPTHFPKCNLNTHVREHSDSSRIMFHAWSKFLEQRIVLPSRSIPVGVDNMPMTRAFQQWHQQNIPLL